LSASPGCFCASHNYSQKYSSSESPVAADNRITQQVWNKDNIIEVPHNIPAGNIDDPNVVVLYSNDLPEGFIEIDIAPMRFGSSVPPSIVPIWESKVPTSLSINFHCQVLFPRAYSLVCMIVHCHNMMVLADWRLYHEDQPGGRLVAVSHMLEMLELTLTRL
jgi:hypothetical protein